jgi:hypothetical protein
LVLLLDLKVDRPGFCAPALALPDALLAGTEFRAEAIDQGKLASWNFVRAESREDHEATTHRLHKD